MVLGFDSVDDYKVSFDLVYDYTIPCLSVCDLLGTSLNVDFFDMFTE